jgi:hypothetical protein
MYVGKGSLKVTGCGHVNWIRLTQVGFSEHWNKPSSFIEYVEFHWLAKRLLASQDGFCLLLVMHGEQKNEPE